MTTEWKNVYKWSRDYDRLQKLLDDGYEVICLADYDFYRDGEHPMERDICRARKHIYDNPEYNHYSVGSRGIVYVDFPMWASKFTTFEKRMCLANVEFIDVEEDEE